MNMRKLFLVLLLSVTATLAFGQGESGGMNWRVRLPQGAAVTMNGTDKTLFTYTIPAPSLGPSSCLDLKVAVQRTSGAASISYKLKFGTQTLTLGSANVGTVLPVQLYICNRYESVTAQDFSYFVFGTSASGVATLGQDTAGSLELAILANGSGGTVAPLFFWLQAER